MVENLVPCWHSHSNCLIFDMVGAGRLISVYLKSFEAKDSDLRRFI